MQKRIACVRCGAHRDAAVWTGPCLVCGDGRSTPVALTDGDIRVMVDESLQRQGIAIETTAA